MKKYIVRDYIGLTKLNMGKPARCVEHEFDTKKEAEDYRKGLNSLAEIYIREVGDA